MTERDLPLLDASRCTGCGECAAICPTECLEMLGPLVWLPRPADCVSCGACADICEPQAIQLAAVEFLPIARD